MKKLYAALMMVFAFAVTNAQDTLKHYNIDDFTESPLETKVTPSSWGYSYGHGATGVHEWAEKYYSTEKNVIGIVVYLDEVMGSATSSEEDWVAIYKKNGNKPAPADKSAAKKTIIAKDLTLGLNKPNVVMLDEPYAIGKDSFFVAFGVPKYPFAYDSPRPEDNIGLLVTGSRKYDTDSQVFYKNAIRYNGGFWTDPTGIAKGDKKRNFLISPIVSSDDTISNVETTLLTNKAITVKSVYPNPVVTSTAVNVEISQKTRMNIQVMDMSGKLVKSFSYGEKGIGNHTFVFNI